MSAPASPRLTLQSRLVPALTVGLLLLHLITPWRGWLVGLVGLGGMWLFGYLWARSLATGLRLTREMRFGWTQVGDRLEERFSVRNHGWAPGLWIEVADHSTLPGYDASRVMGDVARNHWTTRGVCTQRGLFTLGPTSLHSGDPFGLYRVSVLYPATTSVMVAPPIVPLPEIEVAPGGRVGDGRPRPHTIERTLNSAGARKYVPGDDMRWLHWPLSARHGEWYVRLFEGAPVGDWWIVLDLDNAVQVGKGQQATDEHAIILAASLADRALRANRAVGLAAQGETPLWLPPRQGEGQRLAILQALALARRGSQPLHEFLERLRTSLGRNASLIVITPSVAGQWVEALLPFAQRGNVPTVLLLDPSTFGGAADPAAVRSLLSRFGIASHVIPRDLLDRPEARPGQRGAWEWMVGATGRAIARHQPRDTSWRRLE